jgi:hypothetical protein
LERPTAASAGSAGTIATADDAQFGREQIIFALCDCRVRSGTDHATEEMIQNDDQKVVDQVIPKRGSTVVPADQ